MRIRFEKKITNHNYRSSDEIEIRQKSKKQKK